MDFLKDFVSITWVNAAIASHGLLPGKVIAHEFSNQLFVFTKSILHSIKKIQEKFSDVLLLVYRYAYSIVVNYAL